MAIAWEARFILFAAISFASVAFGGVALLALKDRDMAGGMFFNRVREIAAIFPVLQWGMAVPLVAALALTLAGVFIDLWAIPAMAGVLFLVAFASLNYVIVMGSIKLLGWR